MPDRPVSHCPLCGSTECKICLELKRRPPGETDYGITDEKYYRRICKCLRCDVYYNQSEGLPSDLYGGNYNAAICPHSDGLLRRFNSIRSLPPEQSDNKGRVRRVVEFLRFRKLTPESTKILDVGSGTCVFLAEIRDYGYEQVYCVDPDPRAVEHALKVAGVTRAHTGTLDDYVTDLQFDLITFNKVLEHLRDPVKALSQARELLSVNGLIYMELPDGEAAAGSGNLPNRQELYIEHHFAFTGPSIRYLVNRAGLKILSGESLIDPSGKYSRFAFLSV